MTRRGLGLFGFVFFLGFVFQVVVYNQAIRFIGRRELPVEVHSLMAMNDRPPENGTVGGTCIHCGELAGWRKTTVDRVSDIRMHCKKCGGENPYPYPGRL